MERRIFQENNIFFGIKGKRILTVAEDFVSKGLGADAAFKIAQTLDTLRLSGSEYAGKFTKEIPKTKKDYPKRGTGKHYYYTTEGELKVYDSDTGEESDITELVKFN